MCFKLLYLNSNFAKTPGYLNPALNNPALGCENAVTGVHERWRKRGSRRSTFSLDRSLKHGENTELTHYRVQDSEPIRLLKLPRSLSVHVLMTISIYTLSDLGNLNNLIGSLSWTIQEYSPPSEWIMCELGVFPIFF